MFQTGTISNKVVMFGAPSLAGISRRSSNAGRLDGAKIDRISL